MQEVEIKPEPLKQIWLIHLDWGIKISPSRFTISSPLSNQHLISLLTIEFYYLQQIKFKSQLEQQRLQLQREHSSEMEQILEKVSH